MTDADMDPVMRRRPGQPASPSPTQTSIPTHNLPMLPHPRDAAMKRDRSGKGDDDVRRDRDRSDRDRRVSATNPHPGSSRLRSLSPISRRPQDPRDRDRNARGERFHDQSDEPHRPDAGQRGRSQDRSRDNQDSSRAVKDRPPRDERGGKLDQDRLDGIPTSPRHGPRNDNYASQIARDRSFSPSSRKRRRSRSPLPFPPSRPKKSRRERDRDRRRRVERAERNLLKPTIAPRLDRQTPPFRRRSPSPHYDDPRPRYADRGEPLEPHRHRRRSRSPFHEAAFERGMPPVSRSRRDSQIGDRSRSPIISSRRSSFSRTHSPPRPLARPYPGSEAGSYSRRSSPSFDPPRPDFPLRSPRGRGSRRSRKRGKYREDSGFPLSGPLASGANSIEVNMSRRQDHHRGPSGSQMPPTHPAKTHYNDPRSAHSPTHATSGSSYHGSPTSQSPYGGSRGGRGNQPRFSPNDRSNHHPPFHQASHDPPTGPSARRASSQSPPYPPTGPMSQSYTQGRSFSRGGFRGTSHAARSGHRGAVSKSTQWGSGGPAGTGRAHSAQSGENTPQHHSPQYAASNHSDFAAAKEERGDDDDIYRSSKDRQADDPTLEKNNDQMPPPRPPPTAPTGPASSKFSFAFKTANKGPVATPKPEISQKFNTAPKKEPPPPPMNDRDRDLPRDTPREPASARARADYHHNRGPSELPRTRKVKKIQRRLKPKPQLPTDLAASDSVFFRKPGNESVVGSGTYGKVFKGLHVYTKKLVALKRIRMEGERDGFPVTAVREIKLLQSLKHTNIVKLLEVMVEKNDCFMVFEYLSHDLTGLLNHPSYKLDPAQRKHLAKQLFDGLDYLHGRGVLHRDIKAANILVSNDGILKLADFGLARFYAKRHQHDYTNRVITIWYRSPELLLGETQYSAAVDIWSAACVMVEIFTRHAIFPGDGGEISQLEKIYAVLGTPNKTEWPGLVDMPWFELLRPGYRRPNVFAEKYKERVPAAAFDLLASMFQYDPVKRPSAAEVLQHPYFTTEQPPPRQAIELQNLQGDWHEFESKALRKEKEKQEREARRAAASQEGSHRDKDKKRPPSAHDAQRDIKRPHIDERPPVPG
ncbi:Pkinase-domain-containing protein [Xylariaceae sp. FL0662B]|nr:Pkinase-domain-containing protein [Xylariaceae sp. FL0662B]